MSPGPSIAQRLAEVARKAGATAIGRRLTAKSYVAAARLAAQWFMSSPAVNGVYVTGSLTVPERLAAGQSDIDLVLTCRFESDRDELAFARELEARHARLAVLGGLFYNLDYVDVVDLPYLRAFGAEWEIRLDRSSKCIAGVPQWTSPMSRPIAELRSERFVRAARRWFNSGSRLLARGATDRPELVLRSLERTLGDIASAWVDVDRLAPPETIIEKAARRGSDCKCLARLSELGPRFRQADDPVSLLLAASLEALDAFAREIVADWPESREWNLNAPPALPRLSERLQLMTEQLLATGFRAVCCAPRWPSSDEIMAFVVAPPGLAPHEAVALATPPLVELERSATRASGRRPVVLTDAIWNAAALFDPAPFFGATLAVICSGRGSVLEPPLVPPEPTRQALVRARVVESFTLLRSQSLRQGRDRQRAEKWLDEAFSRMLPALRSAQDDGTLDLSPRELAPIGRDPAERIAITRAWCAERRRRLGSLLRERERG